MFFSKLDFVNALSVRAYRRSIKFTALLGAGVAEARAGLALAQAMEKDNGAALASNGVLTFKSGNAKVTLRRKLSFIMINQYGRTDDGTDDGMDGQAEEDDGDDGTQRKEDGRRRRDEQRDRRRDGRTEDDDGDDGADTTGRTM